MSDIFGMLAAIFTSWIGGALTALYCRSKLTHGRIVCERNNEKTLYTLELDNLDYLETKKALIFKVSR